MDLKMTTMAADAQFDATRLSVCGNVSDVLANGVLFAVQGTGLRGRSIAPSITAQGYNAWSPPS